MVICTDSLTDSELTAKVW